MQLYLFALSSDWLQFSVRLLFAQPVQEFSTWAPVFQTLNMVQEQEGFGLIHIYSYFYLPFPAIGFSFLFVFFLRSPCKNALLGRPFFRQ